MNRKKVCGKLLTQMLLFYPPDVKIEPSQVTFEPHHSRVSVNVVGLNDSLIEFMESVVLMLTIESSFLQSVVAGPNNKATIQITGKLI